MARGNLELAIAMGKRMAERRKARGLTQEAVAYMAGITHQQYNKAENGKTCVGSDSLLRISDALQTSADYLLRGEAFPDKYRELKLNLDKMTESQLKLANSIIYCISQQGLEYEKGE